MGTADILEVSGKERAAAFETCLRELLAPSLEMSLRTEGRHDAERNLRGRVRAAVSCARLQHLLPHLDKGGNDVVHRYEEKPMPYLMPSERKYEAMLYNIACLRALVDVLVSLLCAVEHGQGHYRQELE